MPFMVVLGVGCACSPSADLPSHTVATEVDAGDEPVVADTTEIVKGIPSRGRDAAVVAIDVGGEGLCSGAVVHPRVVLTARHCVARTAENVACPSLERQILGDRGPGTLRVFQGDDLSSARLVGVGVEIVVPPTETLCESDMAALVVGDALEGIEPLPLAQKPVVVGDHVRAVGFGRGGGRPGLKLQREHVRILETTPFEFQVGEATCQGDSGGPAFDEETGAIVGVVSRGGPSCQGHGVHNIYTRVDAFRTLVEEAMGRAEARAEAQSREANPKKSKRPRGRTSGKPPTEMGTECQKGDGCASGVCVLGGERGYCSRRCGAGDRCPSGYRCKSSASGETVCIQR